MARNITRSSPRDMMRSGGFPTIQDFFRDFSLAPMWRGMEEAGRMKVDVEETDQAFILRADVPGVKKEDIDISIDGNVVSIRAETSEEKTDDKDKNMIMTERMVGQEFRSFTLPQEVDDSKADAKMENGVLLLTLPKKAGGGRKKLAIQ